VTSMGCGQVQQPRFADCDPAVATVPPQEGRQQPLRPTSWFELARLCGRGLSDRASPMVCQRALAVGFVHGSGHGDSTFLHPFAPPALPGFHATMSALTPGRPALRIPHEHRLGCCPGLSVSCVWPSDHSASNHPAGPVIAFTRYPSASWVSGSLRSRLRHYLASSPPGQAESSSLALRTGRSPPVASHPLSRGRSYLQLQAGERVPEEDLHLSDQTHLRTH
jgi:hypothetical protein